MAEKHDIQTEVDAPVSSDEFFNDLIAEDPEFKEALEEAEPARALAHTVTQLRALRGLTQKELAERIGKHQPAIARIENASVNTGWETFAQILEALQVRMHFSPAESQTIVITREEFDARLESAKQKGFADGMAHSGSLQKMNRADLGAGTTVGGATDTVELEPA
jgi:DNA-binding XRE family transcriptional regulator